MNNKENSHILRSKNEEKMKQSSNSRGKNSNHPSTVCLTLKQKKQRRILQIILFYLFTLKWNKKKK